MNVTNGKYAAMLLLSVCVLIGQGLAKEPDVDVALGVTMSRATYVQGEDTWARVCFTTKSAQHVALAEPEVVNGTHFLYFEVRNDAGSVLKYRGEQASGVLHKVNISKSQPYSKYLNIRWLYDLSSPGTYTIRAVYNDPFAKFRIVSSKHKIEIRKPDSIKVLSSKKAGKVKTYELVSIKDKEDQIFMLKGYVDIGKKRWYGRCVRIKMDKDSVKHASIVQVVKGEKYRGFKIAMGDKVMIVNVQVNGPQVLTRTVNRRADDVELKLARDKKYMLVGKDGKEFPVLEPTTKPATQPADSRRRLSLQIAVDLGKASPALVLQAKNNGKAPVSVAEFRTIGNRVIVTLPDGRTESDFWTGPGATEIIEPSAIRQWEYNIGRNSLFTKPGLYKLRWKVGKEESATILLIRRKSLQKKTTAVIRQKGKTKSDKSE